MWCDTIDTEITSINGINAIDKLSQVGITAGLKKISANYQKLPDGYGE